MKPKALLTALSLVLGAAALAPQILAQAPDMKLDRTVLPILEPSRKGRQRPDRAHVGHRLLGRRDGGCWRG